MKSYDLKDSEKWILPRKLEEQESIESSGALEKQNPKSDFGSYKLLREGNKDSLIEYHNCLGQAAMCYAKAVSYVINKNIENPSSLCDVGCGAGFVANELKNLNDEIEVIGYDISSDGVQFGLENFKRVGFFQQSIEIGMDFGRQFSVIHAREFYPFSRTNNYEFQKDYIETFLKNIDEKGLLVIGNIHNEVSIFNNYTKLKKELERDTRYSVEKVTLPKTFIYRVLHSFRLAGFFSHIVNVLLGQKHSYLMVIKKRGL